MLKTFRGIRATMPPRMISERPLPIPCSVISSPSQTANIVPAVIVTRMVTVESHCPAPKPKPAMTPGTEAITKRICPKACSAARGTVR